MAQIPSTATQNGRPTPLKTRDKEPGITFQTIHLIKRLEIPGDHFRKDEYLTPRGRASHHFGGIGSILDGISINPTPLRRFKIDKISIDSINGKKYLCITFNKPQLDALLKKLKLQKNISFLADVHTSPHEIVLRLIKSYSFSVLFLLNIDLSAEGRSLEDINMGQCENSHGFGNTKFDISGEPYHIAIPLEYLTQATLKRAA